MCATFCWKQFFVAAGKSAPEIEQFPRRQVNLGESVKTHKTNLPKDTKKRGHCYMKLTENGVKMYKFQNIKSQLTYMDTYMDMDT